MPKVNSDKLVIIDDTVLVKNGLNMCTIKNWACAKDYPVSLHNGQNVIGKSEN